MGEREPVALLWVSFWCLVTVSVLWLSSWWGRESRLLYFECLTGVLWMFVFCGFHLDGKERAVCITLSAFLMSCDCLCFVAFILMGKREPVALLWVSYWCLVTVRVLWLSSWLGREAACITLSVLLVSCDYLCSVAFILMGKRELLALLLVSYWSLVTVCVCGLHLDGEKRAARINLSYWSLVTFCVLLLSSWTVALLWVSYWCLVTVCVLWLSSWWERESWLRCFTLRVFHMSCDYLCSVAIILMGKREQITLLSVSFWCLVTVCVLWL